ncbi:extracellular solute-binding protein [Rhodobacter capsulatus]|uniref:Putrescine-binding periplasmic protein n=1 Tax=Rhodobacter capsulatus TaxID=1061 RepID=A0A4V5PPB2_RHOCA|nr:extracellular solute-binding protein [Rhodobacter capsulatus]TKD21922.1 extracellular solute-binding protein [Rhodobacter capsulatus]
MQKALLLAGAFACLSLPAMAQQDRLHIYAWQDLFAPQILDDFTAATGLKTVYDSYDSDETLETRLLSGDTGYDFIVPSASPFLMREIQAGALEKLDKSLIPNYDKQIPALLELLKKSDPTLEYAAIGGWGTTGLGYNLDKVKALLPDAPLDSYDLIFKPENAAKLKDCGIAMVDSPTDIVPITLNYLGLNPETTDPDEIRQAMEVLAQIRPYVTLDKGRMMTDMANGDICLAIGFSGDLIGARMRATEAGNGQHITYVIPKEGTLAWISALAIPKNAPNPAAGNAFINHLLDPKQASVMSLTLGYANGVEGSRALLPPEMANDPVMFPDDATMQRLFTGSAENPKVTRLLNREWTRFRTAN